LQLKRLPSRVTNGLPAFQFQRVIDRFTDRSFTYILQNVNAALDDVTLTGATIAEHDKNLNCLLVAVPDCRLTLNEEKSQIRVTTLTMPGIKFLSTTS